MFVGGIHECPVFRAILRNRPYSENQKNMIKSSFTQGEGYKEMQSLSCYKVVGDDAHIVPQFGRI